MSSCGKGVFHIQHHKIPNTKILLPVVLLLTQILVGVSSVCGHIDKEDTLAYVVPEVHRVTAI